MKRSILLAVSLCVLLCGCSADISVLSLAAAPALERCAGAIMERDESIAPLPVVDDAAALNQLISGACDAVLVSARTELPKGVVRIERVAAGALHAIGQTADIGAWRGDTVAIMAARASDEAAMLLSLLESYYIKSDDAHVLYLAPGDMEAALNDKRAYNALLFAPIGDTLVKRLLKHGRLCSIPQTKCDTLIARFEDLAAISIPDGTYGGGEPVGTLVIPAQLVMLSDADDAARIRMLDAASEIALK